MRKWLVAIVVVLVAVPLFAISGIEGTMEYALDAPWRIEPSWGSDGQLEYGSIPIQVSIHDADIIPLDSPGRTLGHFCELTVEEATPTGRRIRHFGLSGLAEVEKGERWRPPELPPTPVRPPFHRVCRPAEAPDRCESLRSVSDSAEWHAVAWYAPAVREPGSDIPLTISAKLSRSTEVPCTTSDAYDFITLRNFVTVHLGETFLPRFDNRWLYGDLHYHSQGTDNDGETAYNYRGVIRAMGAIGLDFVFAAEHASNSRQIIDAEVDLGFCKIKPITDDAALRDMSPTRFRYLNDELHDTGGVNRTTALDGPSSRMPQGYLSHRVIPQIFLGGEIDAIPETENEDVDIPYGNGLSYSTFKLLGGWLSPASYCLFPGAPYIRERADNGFLVTDVQGINQIDYGREHLVYLPKIGSDRDAFVASNTGDYGGARRRLAERHGDEQPLLPEIEEKGYAFLAHPLNAGAGGGGPDGPPWSQFMLRKAWRSPAVLGLQFWNEPERLKTRVVGAQHKRSHGEAIELGYEFYGSWLDEEAKLAQSERKGFARGRFLLAPYHSMQARSFETFDRGVERQLHHGAYTWDRLLLLGLNTIETSALSWLPDGEPRRFFAAAGSDAHGDLNYRRNGYFIGTTDISDVAIAKARNLLFAGDPTLPRDENIPAASGGPPAERHSHDQVVQALAEGHFSLTEGPALRIVIDRNRNGRIDDADTPMGGVVELYGERTLPLIIQWRSTTEFGEVARISLYVGTRNDQAGVDADARVYAPALHGPRDDAELPGDAVVESYRHDGRTYARMEDSYWRDPTGLLDIRLAPASLRGSRSVALPLPAFEADRNAPADRFYVRAFAETVIKDAEGCRTSTTAELKGACIRRYALTNPIWAISKAPADGTCPRSGRALDRDADGLPDGCDPCPDSVIPACVVAPAGGALATVQP